MKPSGLFLTVVVLCFAPQKIARAETITVRDTILADATWSADTVKVENEITILDDITLTIEPGTRVEFLGHYGITVLGTLIAEGTGTETIVFTPSDTSGFYNPDSPDGSWTGILFNNNAGSGADGAMVDNDSSRIVHCRIEFTKSLPDDPAAWGGIEIWSFSKLRISDCEFRLNHTQYRGGAIKAYTNSDIVIRNNYIHHNSATQWGGGIYLHNSSALVTGNTIEYNITTTMNWDFRGAGGGIGILGMKPVILNNTIRNNSAITGAGIYSYNSFGLIQGNIISYNDCYSDPPNLWSMGGGITCVAGSAPKILNNFIANNTSDQGGGLFLESSEPVIIGNLIVNNSTEVSGGAIYSAGSSEILVNNTIAHNKSNIAGAIEFTDSDPVFMNNIVWNNPDPGGGQIKLLGYFAKLQIRNSVIENGLSSIYGESTPTEEGLIEEDPGFLSVSPGTGAGYDGLSGDWSVNPSSPCVNAGSPLVRDLPMPARDLAGYDRILHSMIDIGAYEVYIPSITAQDTIKVNTTWIADTVNITGDLVIRDDVILTILPGTWVVAQGRYKIQVIGAIRAIGTETEPIHFTMADTTGNKDLSIPDGSWKGIFFDNEIVENAMADNEPSELRYCDISYVKSLEEEAFQHSALYVNHYSGLVLSNCTFRDNSAAHEPASLFLRKSNVDVINCGFYNNSGSEGPAIWAESADFSIENCEFRENRALDFGGAVRTNGCSLIVKDNTFIYNRSDFRGGALYIERTKARISHNHFLNNSAPNWGGAIFALYENFQLINNVIANNSSGTVGGGLYCLYVDDALSVNNTISNNWANNGGGGMYTAFANHTSLNDIMYGNDATGYGKQYAMYSVTSAIVFRNTNLEGGTGEIGFWVGQELTGTYTDVIDALPEFTAPTEGPGADIDASGAKWDLKPISPCINKGTLLGIAGFLENTDIYGSPRVFDDRIDIGASESQYGLPQILHQPDNYIGCAGDTVVFSVGTQHPSFYQWQKDGEEIPGATQNELILEDITPQDDGNYKCLVTNSFGSLETNPVYLIARSAPEFIRQPEDMWAIEGERTTINSIVNGTPPMSFQWYKDGNLLPGKTYPDLLIPDTDPGDEGRYHCVARNACSTINSDTVQLYMAPQICMVTVDTATGKNLVIWEKKSIAPIASYNVYRESIVAGEYDAIGNVPAESLSVFTDETAKPASQAYIYKITAVTAEGMESNIDLCKPHKTIHLLSSRNTEYGWIQLDWDYYYGFDYGTFYIFRSLNRSPFEIHQLIASTFTTWTDIEGSPYDTIYYRVAVERAEMCYPTEGKKAGTGPYTHALSNLDDNKKKAVGIDNVLMGTLRIYPNPFTESTTVEFPNPDLSEYRYLIRDLSGKTVRAGIVSSNRLIIERGSLAAGMYSIELTGRKIYRDRLMVR
jgi:predicted outer membrane repeat protein